MGKRILITSTDLMMVQFLVPHVINLSENGYCVEVACSEVGGRLEEVRQKLNGYVAAVHQVRLHRSPVKPGNIQGYRDMKKIIETGKYDVIWTNEPVMGVVTRLAARKARKAGTKVLYMAHGFHFYNGASNLNWLIYYPIEKQLSRLTDVICTINHEDYERAKSFYAKRVVYIHGIGINTQRLTRGAQTLDIRREQNIPRDAFIILSVGELNKNKNQKTIIRALAQLKDLQIHYLLCGKGDQLENLQNLAQQLGIADWVHFLGYRKDVVDICSQADLYVMPSYREGLPVSSLEAMYCGLPLISSNIRGLTDVNITGVLVPPDDVEGFAKGISYYRNNRELAIQVGLKNKELVLPFCIDQTKTEVLELIAGL